MHVGSGWVGSYHRGKVGFRNQILKGFRKRAGLVWMEQEFTAGHGPETCCTITRVYEPLVPSLRVKALIPFKTLFSVVKSNKEGHFETPGLI